jgi:hypothetical protein
VRVGMIFDEETDFLEAIENFKKYPKKETERKEPYFKYVILGFET